MRLSDMAQALLRGYGRRGCGMAVRYETGMMVMRYTDDRADKVAEVRNQTAISYRLTLYGKDANGTSYHAHRLHAILRELWDIDSRRRYSCYTYCGAQRVRDWETGLVAKLSTRPLTFIVNIQRGTVRIDYAEMERLASPDEPVEVSRENVNAVSADIASEIKGLVVLANNL